MRKHIAWVLILVMLLLAGCQSLGPVNTDPSGPALQNTTPTATQPTESQPTEPQLTEPQPTEPLTTEPKPTEPLPTEPEPTQPKPEIPDGFPDDINTDPAMVAVFQELFGKGTWYAQAIFSPFEYPQNANIRALFDGGFDDESPETDTEREEIVKLMGSDFYYDLDMYRLPADKMNAVLQEVFGLTLDDVSKARLKYLESTQCYYIVGGGSCAFVAVDIVGVKTLDNGNVELYYQTTDPTCKGVVTLKPVEGGYHILSNYHNEDGTWPEDEIPKPEIPEGFPDDIDTDPATVAVFQELFADNTWYAQALDSPFDDPAKAHIAYLFGGFGFEDEPPITKEERAEIVKLSNYKDYEWMPGYRLPVDKMNAVLQTLFGLTLEDMDLSTAVYLEYLESTNCYYRLGSDSAWSGCFEIVGTKNLDNGNIEVYYYRNMGIFDEDDRPRGVAVLKPVEDGYHIVANDNNFYYWNENFHPWLT